MLDFTKTIYNKFNNRALCRGNIKMRFLIFALFVGLALAATIPELSELANEIDIEHARELYAQFKRKYKNDHSNDVDEMRFEIFKHNLHSARLHQSLEQGTAEYGVTQFSDLTTEEFVAMYANAKFDQDIPYSNLHYDLNKVPANFDWREHGAVNPVENQGHCSSCWAFSTMGNLEGQWFLKKNKTVVLSKQQLVDCDRVDHGCHGGLMTNAFNEIRRMGGAQSQDSYPYTGRKGECQLGQGPFVAHLNGSVRVIPDERAQAAFLASHGPLSSAINVNALQFYRRGIIHPNRVMCHPFALNHAVLTVGYGVNVLSPYWIVKNSWGPDWGEQGYFRIYRGDGTCGINRFVTSAVVL